MLYVAPGELLVGAQLPPRSTASLTYWKEGAELAAVTKQFEPAWDRIDYVRLTELEPGGSYCLEVTIDGRKTRRYPFVAGAAASGRFRFLVIGDTKPDTELPHRSLVAAMTARPASFYIHLGDIVREGDLVDDWNLFFETERPLMNRMPLLPVVGNHDRSQAGLFEGLFLLEQRHQRQRRYYAARFGNALVLAIDSTQPVAVGDAQYRFVREALEEAAADASIEHVFVALHKPLVSSGRHGATKSLAATLRPLLERYPVTAVLAGHDHDYERTEPIQGIVHVVSGGGGALLRRVDPGPRTALALSTYQFVEIEVDGAQVTLRAFNEQGEMIDEARLD